MAELQNKFYLNARDDRAARLRGDRPVGCAWRLAGDRKIPKSMFSGDGGACLDFEGEGDALAAAGGLGGVATKRPRASVAVFTDGGALRGGVVGVAGAASGARVASASLKRLRARSSNGAGSITRRHSTRSAQSSASRVLTCVEIELQAPHARENFPHRSLTVPRSSPSGTYQSKFSSRWSRVCPR